MFFLWKMMIVTHLTVVIKVNKNENLLSPQPNFFSSPRPHFFSIQRSIRIVVSFLPLLHNTVLHSSPLRHWAPPSPPSLWALPLRTHRQTLVVGRCNHRTSHSRISFHLTTASDISLPTADFAAPATPLQKVS